MLPEQLQKTKIISQKKSQSGRETQSWVIIPCGFITMRDVLHLVSVFVRIKKVTTKETVHNSYRAANIILFYPDGPKSLWGNTAKESYVKSNKSSQTSQTTPVQPKTTEDDSELKDDIKLRRVKGNSSWMIRNPLLYTSSHCKCENAVLTIAATKVQQGERMVSPVRGLSGFITTSHDIHWIPINNHLILDFHMNAHLTIGTFHLVYW